MASRELDRIAPFEFQMAVWGYDTAGQVAELSAMICEQPEWRQTPNGYPLWDRDRAHLDSILVSDGDEGYHRPPEWWALPHVPWRDAA